MNSSNLVLGDKLRAHRESRGITLDALAESTKIKRSLLRDLERNDLSRFPGGIYGRAIIREYGKAIGFPANDLVEGLKFFDEGEPPSPTAVDDSASGDGGSDFRLMLADVSAPRRLLSERAGHALAAVAVILLIGAVVSVAGGVRYWTATGILALIGCALSIGVGEQSWRRLGERYSRWSSRRGVHPLHTVHVGRVFRGAPWRRRDHVSPASLRIDPDADALSRRSPYIH